MRWSRRVFLQATGSAGISGFAGCTATRAELGELREALATTLRVSQEVDTRLHVGTAGDFEHDVLVEEAGHAFSLDMPSLEAATTELVPRETVHFYARQVDSNVEHTHIATYTEPFRDPPRPRGHNPKASVRFVQHDATTVESILVAVPHATSARIVYPDDRSDDILLWAGHRITATGLPEGSIRVYGAYETDERLVGTYVIT